MNEGLITFLASFLIWIMFLGVTFLWLIDGRIKKEVALHAIFASILAWVITEMVKNLIPSIRPFDQNGFTPLTLTVPIGGAFPSGHSAASFALAVSVLLHQKRLGIVFLVGAVGVGIGRVMGNVHFPVDILGGAILGIMCAIFIKRAHLFKFIGGKNRGLDI